MDVRFINPFIKSVANTFGTMCKLPVTFGKPGVKSDDELSSEVTSIIGFSGDAAGSVVLHFSYDMASKTASRFAGVDITPQHPDFADAIGELVNIVAGGAKAQFDGMSISISLPTVIVGNKHSVSRSKSVPRIVVPCNTEVGSFIVEIGIVIGKKMSGASLQHATIGSEH